jgi:hypothetical protein
MNVEGNRKKQEVKAYVEKWRALENEVDSLKK